MQHRCLEIKYNNLQQYSAVNISFLLSDSQNKADVAICFHHSFILSLFQKLGLKNEDINMQGFPLNKSGTIKSKNKRRKYFSNHLPFQFFWMQVKELLLEDKKGLPNLPFGSPSFPQSWRCFIHFCSPFHQWLITSVV